MYTYVYIYIYTYICTHHTCLPAASRNYQRPRLFTLMVMAMTPATA